MRITAAINSAQQRLAALPFIRTEQTCQQLKKWLMAAQNKGNKEWGMPPYFGGRFIIHGPRSTLKAWDSACFHFLFRFKGPLTTTP
jgi:hypothetical protein